MKTWSAVPVIVLLSIGTWKLAAGQSADPEPACLQSSLGALVHEVKVSARSGRPVNLPITAGGDYFIVASGTFAFSDNGRQDALRRWHEPFDKREPICVSCRLHSKESRISFVINGKTEVPLRECPFQHLYLYHLVSPSNMLVLQINDAKLWGDPFADNSGELRVRVYRDVSSHPLLRRDRQGFVLDQAVGRQTEELRLGTGRAEGYFATSDSNTSHRIEIHGVLSIEAGIEQDFAYRWDFRKQSQSKMPFIRFHCDSVRELAADPSAHRYLIETSGCLRPLRAELVGRGAVLGQLRLRRFTP